MEIHRLSIYTAQIAGRGSESGLIRLAKGFCNRGYDVDFVSGISKAEISEDLPNEVRQVDFDVSDKHPLTLSVLPKMIDYLRSEQPDVMISCPGAVNVAPIISRPLAGVDTKIIAKGGKKPPKECLKDSEYRSFVMSILMRTTYPFADEIIIGERNAGDRLLSTTPIKKDDLHVIPQPVVTPNLLTKAKESIDHPWFDSDDTPVILAAQNLTEPKDTPTIIKAFAHVKKGKNVRLLILGEGEKREEIEFLIEELELEDDVEMPGFVPNPYKYMKNADLFVLSSKKDTLPSALIEAMACGCPVVATDCPPGGVASILENGKWGALVPIGEPKQMASAMNESLNIPVEGVQERVNDYSLAQSVDAHLEVISQI